MIRIGAPLCPRFLASVLVMTGSFGGAWACGRTGLGTGLDFVDEVGDDGGSGDGSTSCGASGQRCCNGAACDNGLTCNEGTCAGASSDDAGPPALSCAPGGPGMTNCGARSDNCCASLEVAGGSFDRTYSRSGSRVSYAGDPASVSTFRLDEYLVTVGRFRQFVQAWNGGAGYTPPAGSGKHSHLNGGRGLANSGSPGTYEPGWVATDDSRISPTTAHLTCSPPAPYPDFATWTSSAGNRENLPINCVNWYEAYAFCIWDGGFLPSDAEWEYAAAGGSRLREYPWGETDPGTSSQFAIFGCGYPCGSYVCRGVQNIAPVGTAPLGAGLWGQLDLAGEVDEWNLDFAAPYQVPCVDCAYLTTAPTRATRGGSFSLSSSDTTGTLHPWVRGADLPTARSFEGGFRCARTPGAGVDGGMDAGTDGATAGTTTFRYTGAEQDLTIPTGVRRVTISAQGAAGGETAEFGGGGAGGSTVATIDVTPGETLAVFVGGQGGANSGAGAAGGFNGGGAGGGDYGTGGGGGASDVRQGGIMLANRVVVAGGGGGGGGYPEMSTGGGGGTTTGGVGEGTYGVGGGGGGTQTRGGAGGDGEGNPDGMAGTLREGGAGASSSDPGGGGGGGYYCGGGGGGGGAGGGGGSSFALASATSVTMVRGVRAGFGQVVITW